MKKHESMWSQYFDVSNDGLRSYFGSVVKGRSKILYGAWMNVDSEQKVQSVLSDWTNRLEKLKTEWPTLYDFEIEMRDKVGPMSIMLPLGLRMGDVESYYESIKPGYTATPVPEEAINKVLEEYQAIQGLTMRTQRNTVEQMRLNTNSGSPYFTDRSEVVNKSCPILDITTWHDENPYNITMGTSHDKWKYCAILGWRGQEGGPTESDTKQRVVWMFPFAVNICELQVYQVLTEACQKHNLVSPWVSMEAVDDRITALFDTKGKDDLIICTDFSKFDQHFNVQLQNCAESILRKLFSGDKFAAKRDWFRTVFPVKYSIPIALSWGNIKFGLHGMGSGSGGTNADETLAHRALQHEAALSDKAALNLNSMCLGDDGILSYPGINTDKVLKVYTAHGLEMNESKQYASTYDCVFLRRWHHKDYRINGKCAGVYSTCRALGRLMYKERYHRDWSYIDETLRTLSIMENCKNHPMRDEFAAYVMERDRYHLGKDIPDFFANIDEIAKERSETIHAELSYTNTMNKQTGLKDWWIVQYVLQH